MSTFKLAPVLRQRFFDANGEPLAGGLLYSYIANTSTPKPTYTDSTGGTPNANPVVLDSEGYANVWLTLDGVGYKFALHDASDNPLWTVDNVILVQNNVVANIQFQNGSTGPILTLQPPTPIAPGSYSLTLPAIPASKSFMTLDTSGNMAADVSLTLGITNGMLAGGINANKFAAGTQLPILTPAVKTANYDPLAVDGQVIYDTTAGALSGTLFTVASAPGYTIRIKNQANFATCTNLLTINGNGTDTINGAASTTMTAGEVLVLTNDRTGDWKIISRTYPMNEIDGGAIVWSTSGGGSAPVPGSLTSGSSKIYWRRVGNTMIGRVQFRQTGAGSAGSGGTGLYLVQIPGGWTMDSALVDFDNNTGVVNSFRNSVGTLMLSASGSRAPGSNFIAFDSTHLSAYAFDVVASTENYWRTIYYQLSATTLSANGIFQVPIVGWAE